MMNQLISIISIPIMLFTSPSQSNIIKPVNLDISSVDYRIELQNEIDFKINTFNEIKRKVNLRVNQMYRDEIQKSKGIDITILATYYTHLPSEGSGTGFMANGDRVHYGAIACPYNIPFGSKIVLENGKEFICKDRGNPDYIKHRNDGIYRMDIYIPKYDHESNSQYQTRVRNYGTDLLKAKLFLN